MKKVLISCVTLFYVVVGYAAIDLKQAYELSLKNDAKYLAAKNTFKVVNQDVPIAASTLLPNLSASANTVGNNSNSVAGGSRYNTNNYKLNLSQSIINVANWLDLSKAKYSVKSAHYNLLDAEQDLILRVVTSYFEILKSQDELDLQQAKLKFFTRQFEQVSDRYNSGLIAVTDVHEAEARRDGSYADELAARTSLSNSKDALGVIVGSVGKVAIINKKVKLLKPSPFNLDSWLSKAVEQNYSLLAADAKLKSLRKEVHKNSAGHLPTLSLDGSVSNQKNIPNSNPSRTVNKTIGLSLNIPIFQGGGVIAGQRKAAFSYQESKESYHGLIKQVKSDVKQSYREVMTQIKRVNALQKTVKSTTSALESVQEAFNLGKRTITDVLDANSNKLNAVKNYKSARYNYLLATLQLKKLVGSLDNRDIKYVAQYMDKR